MSEYIEIDTADQLHLPREILGVDRHGIVHRAYRYDPDRVGCEAWCSGVGCLEPKEPKQVNCLLCAVDMIAYSEEVEDGDSPEPDDELDPWAPDDQR